MYKYVYNLCICGILLPYLYCTEPGIEISYCVFCLVTEVLGALLSVSVIWVLTAVFVFVAVQRIVSGIYEIHSNAMMLVSIFGIFVNIVYVNCFVLLFNLCKCK